MWYTFLSSSLSPFVIFEVWNHWSVPYFLVSVVCVSWCLQVGDAWREDEGLSLRHRCLLAPPRGSWAQKRGLKSPCALNYCQRAGSVHIDLIITFIASRPTQSSKALSSQVSIWDRGVRFLHLLVLLLLVFTCQLLPLILFSPVFFYPNWGQEEVAQGEGKIVWARTWNMCEKLFMFSCWSAWVWANCLAESLLKMSCILDVQIFIIFLLLLEKMNSMKRLSSPHLWWVCFFVRLVSIHSAGIHCLQSICQLLCNHCPTKVLIFLPSFPSPFISASTNQRKSLVYF